MARLVEDVEGIKILDDQDRVVLLIALNGAVTVSGSLTASGVVASNNLRFPNSAATASAVGSVAKKSIVYNAAGATLGYIPIYTSIT